jgi:hypothetical protein
MLPTPLRLPLRSLLRNPEGFLRAPRSLPQAGCCNIRLPPSESQLKETQDLGMENHIFVIFICYSQFKFLLFHQKYDFALADEFQYSRIILGT